MSTRCPPTLLHLAVQSLLRDKDLVIQAVDELPGNLFPPLFMEAFNRGHTEVLKAMVPAWPFPCLPLGALMDMRKPEIAQTRLDIVKLQAQNLQILQAALEGLDVLLAQKVRPRRWKLQVLDMRDMHQDFWRVWAGNVADAGFPEVTNRRKMKNCPKVAEKQPLKVITDLHLGLEILDPFISFLFKWAQDRKDFLQLECMKLCIAGVPHQPIAEVLEVVDLGCTEVVELHCFWALSVLCTFAPYLSQMRSLHKLFLSNIQVPGFFSPEEREQFVTEFTSHFLNQHYLQAIYMNCVSFLEGHLAQVLGCLKAPLETLSITHSQLSHSDWNHLSQCASISELKHLYLRGVRLTDFSPEPLRVLLEKAAGTLTTLHLEDCGMTDSQLSAIVPALSHCFQLTTFSCIENSISVATLEDLLRHTAKLSNLRLEKYPVPREVHGPQHAVQPSRLEVCDALMRIVKPLSHPRNAWLSTTHCHQFGTWAISYLKLTQCSSCVPI